MEINWEKKYNEALERARALREEAIEKEYVNDYVKDYEAIFPELAESEDERIRKEMVDFVNHYRHNTDLTTEQAKWCKMALAWLEKQKEQKPNYCHHEVDLSGCSEEYRKAYYDGWNNCNMQHEQLKEDQQRITPEDKMSHPLYVEGFEAGKQIGAQYKSVFGKQKEQKPAEKQDYSGLNDLERAILRGFLAAGVENIPVGIIKETAQECLAQMKPAEWSEEDEKMLHKTIAAIDYLECEETMKIYNGNKHADPGHYRMISGWLKSLRPQPQWKPSEEQMEALDMVLTDEAMDDNVHTVLTALKKQLKKLM